MTRLMLTAILLTVAVAAAADLPEAVTDADGWVHLAYPAREGVHGDRHVVITDDGEEIVIEGDHDDGLVHLLLRVDHGAVDRLDVRVGRRPARREREARDLGEVAAADAAAYLLDLADRERDAELAADAVNAAAIADTETWPRLLDVARDRERPGEVREAAIFWLGMAAGDKVERELVAIVDDDSEDIEIREHAVFALHQAVEDDTDRAVGLLGHIATDSPHPQVRRSALFWLAQHDDPAVVDLFESILLD